jgi:signal peptidase
MIARRTKRVASLIGLAACFALSGAIAIPAALGYERYVITSGSMTGSYDRGSIVYSERAPVDSLRVGDVITYLPPGSAGDGGLVTHRIVWAGADRSGRRAFRTKGDANPVADPWRFTLDGRTEARAAFGIPYLGYGISALAIREVRMLFIGLPALLVALAVLARLWRGAGAEARRRKAGTSAEG